MSNSTPHPFSADRPIRSSTEDVLGRASFAEPLARAIAAWRQRDSLVLALTGPWGHGKTSVKNMAVETLRALQPGASAIVEFNPWEWASQDRVSEAFFEEIALQLGHVDTTRAGKARVAKWRAYAAKLNVGSVAAVGLRSLFTALFSLLAALGIADVLINDNAISVLIRVIFALVAFFAVVLSNSRKVADAVADALARTNERNVRSLPEIKDDLRRSLAQLNAPVLVIIDDIDRLEPEQMAGVFQLVKANADFPNLVYLLLFPRRAVTDALAKDDAAGDEFLEKIIQVRFDIPQVDRVRLERVLTSGLDDILREVPGETFSSDRWINLYVPGLSVFFETLRDVRRYLGTLAFQVSLFKSEGSFEVNIVDLIALEVLRVFVPPTYERIALARSMLTDLPHDTFGGDQTHQNEVKEAIVQIIDSAPEDRRESVREIIKQLFPTVEWALGGSHYGSDFRDEWLKAQRVCHPELFDRYFQLAVPERDISQAEIDRILAFADDRAKLSEQLTALHQRGMLPLAFSRLESYKQDIDLSVAVPFVTAIFDVGDLLPERSGFFDISPDMHAIRIIHWYLKREPDANIRKQVLLRAMEDTTGLYLPIKKTSIERGKQENKRDPDLFLVDEEALPELRQAAVGKIEQAAKDGSLRSNPHLAYILFRWRDWSDQNALRDWVDELTGQPDGLVLFLTAMASPVTSTALGSYASHTQWRINVANIEALTSLDQVERRVADLDREALSPDAMRAVEAFDRALRRRAEGKSDDPFDDDDF